jgi:hypothetical protein
LYSLFKAQTYLGLFNCYAHKKYKHYKAVSEGLLQSQQELCSNFPNKTVFAAMTINMGPCSFSPPHMDADNDADGLCTDTACGNFDPDQGGQLVLWDLGLVIWFPPGASILFPSSLITHSTLPVAKNETRYVILQFTSGELSWWQENGYQSDQTYHSKASPEELEKRLENWSSRWQHSLQTFTRWNDLACGDWKGQHRTAAGLDELSKLSDLEEETPPAVKQVRVA